MIAGIIIGVLATTVLVMVPVCWYVVVGFNKRLHVMEQWWFDRITKDTQ